MQPPLRNPPRTISTPLPGTTPSPQPSPALTTITTIPDDSVPGADLLEGTRPPEETSTLPANLQSLLPGAPRPAISDLGRATIWLYGQPKIGKTTFASTFPGAWFIATERGQQWVSVREPTLVETWTQFLEVCAVIDKYRPTHFQDGQPIRTIVIDTFDLLFKMCFDAVCAEMGVADPGEIPHGGGWGRLDREFARVMNRIARWPYGLICISHERTREVKTRGRKMDRIEPYVGAAGARWATQAADLILYAHVREVPVKDDKGNLTGEIEEHRMLQLQPSALAVAGGRMSSRLPPLVPLDYNALRAYFTHSAPPERPVFDPGYSPADEGAR